MKAGSWTNSALVALRLVLLAGVLIVGGAAQAQDPGQGGPGDAPQPAMGIVETRGRGLLDPPVDLSHLDGNWRLAASTEALPARWDWRQQSIVTKVQNQGACGSCYSFATLGSLESQIQVKGGDKYDFSENNAAECNYEEKNCNWGNIWLVSSYLSAYGTVLESCDPSDPSDQPCNRSCPYIKTVTDMWALGSKQVPPVETLKGWLRTYGPLYIAMDSSSSSTAWKQEFERYDGSYTLYSPASTPSSQDHAVLLVGWDDNLAHAGGKGAWIVKNSWGTAWGGTAGFGAERGYFTMAYGSAALGGVASFVQGWVDYDPQGALLHIDEAGVKAWYRWSGNPTAHGLAKLVPAANGCAGSVEMWTADAISDIDVYVYDSFDGQSPSGLMAKRENVRFDYAGYHSIALDKTVNLQRGNDVWVMAKVTNATSDQVLAIDNFGPSAANQSYASQDGSPGSWYDIGASNRYDVGLRLRMVPCAAPATPTPTRTRPPATTTATPTRTPKQPTASPSATRGTPAASPTVTRTSGPPTRTPTRAPVVARLKLPLVLSKARSLSPTPTLSVTPGGATATPSPSATGRPTTAPTVTPTGDARWVTIMEEDFEDPFPGKGWELADYSEADKGEYLWGRDDYFPNGGLYSAWPARSGADGLDPDEYYYPDNLDTWMAYGPFDLSDAIDAELLFYFLLDTELEYGFLSWGAWTSVADVDGESISGWTSDWTDRRFSLGPWLGESEVYVGFGFTSDASESGDGPFIDDILLRKMTAAGP